jgi:hypothetical protein
MLGLVIRVWLFVAAIGVAGAVLRRYLTAADGTLRSAMHAEFQQQLADARDALTRAQSECNVSAAALMAAESLVQAQSTGGAAVVAACKTLATGQLAQCREEVAAARTAHELAERRLWHAPLEDARPQVAAIVGGLPAAGTAWVGAVVGPPSQDAPVRILGRPPATLDGAVPAVVPVLTASGAADAVGRDRMLTVRVVLREGTAALGGFHLAVHDAFAPAPTFLGPDPADAGPAPRLVFRSTPHVWYAMPRGRGPSDAMLTLWTRPPGAREDDPPSSGLTYDGAGAVPCLRLAPRTDPFSADAIAWSIQQP